jgi:hypothetical protein
LADVARGSQSGQESSPFNLVLELSIVASAGLAAPSARTNQSIS